MKHCASMHSGTDQEFKLKLVQVTRGAFQRQVLESILISNGVRDHTLNSKSEWMGEALPRLTIEVKDEVIQVDHDGKKLVIKRGPPGTQSQATKRIKIQIDVPSQQQIS